MSATKTRPNRKLLLIGGALLLPPGWIVFDGMRNLAGMPTWLALFTVGSLALITICLIFQGLINLGSGDVKDARVQFVAAGAIIVAEFVGQWWFAFTERHAPVTGLVMATMSVGGALIIEGEIMRVWRANARRSGQMSLARAQVPFEVAKAYPVVGDIFTRLAIRYPNATQRSLLDRAFAMHDAQQQAADFEQQRVDLAELEPPVITVVATDVPKAKSVKPAKARQLDERRQDHDDEQIERDEADGIPRLPSERARELLPVARTVRSDYREDHEGRDISRDALAQRLRTPDQSCPTDLAGELLRLLKAEDSSRRASG